MPSKILELSLAHSFGSEQVSNSIELGLSFKKRYKRYYYLTYVGVFAQHINSAFDDELPDLSTSALGIRLGVGAPLGFPKLPIVFFTRLGYAPTTTQKDPWWGLPENSLKEVPLFIFSVGVKVIFKKYSLYIRQDLNSFSTYSSSQFAGMGYIF